MKAHDLTRLDEAASGSTVLQKGGATFVIRKARVEDGPEVWRMVRDSTLDLNSAYAYLMMFRDYAETCAVAERNGEVQGFVSAYRPPRQPDVLFVWQVGVDEAARGKGLAGEMIQSILRRPGCASVRFVEATVTPSNDASLRLFRGLARKLATHCEESICFPEHLFPEDGHESEWLLRIGPFSQRRLKTATQVRS